MYPVGLPYRVDIPISHNKLSHPVSISGFLFVLDLHALQMLPTLRTNRPPRYSHHQSTIASLIMSCFKCQVLGDPIGLENNRRCGAVSRANEEILGLQPVQRLFSSHTFSMGYQSINDCGLQMVGNLSPSLLGLR